MTTLADMQQERDDNVEEYEAIRSQYAEFDDLYQTNESLKPFRNPTAPAEDLSRERQLILYGPRESMLMLQIALFFTVLSLLSFLFLSTEMAQGVTFLLLSTGVALGFFLRK
jgi:hypothetical protein